MKTTKDLLKANILQNEIKKINGTTHPNTMIRARAVLDRLKGVSGPDVAEVLNVNYTTVNNWKKKYLNEGIDGLEKLERISITRVVRKSLINKELSEKVIQDQNELDIKRYPKTDKRLTAILKVINDGRKIKEAAKESGLKHHGPLLNWINLYEKGGIEGLRKIEKNPLTNSRDTSKDSELASEIIELLKDFDPENPYGKQQVKEILKIINGTKSVKEVADKMNINERQVNIWFREINKKTLKTFLLSSKNSPANKRLRKEKKYNYEENALKLENELKTLDPNEFKNTIIRAKAVLKILKDKKITVEHIDELKISRDGLIKWLNKYLSEGLDGLKKMEQYTLNEIKPWQYLIDNRETAPTEQEQKDAHTKNGKNIKNKKEGRELEPLSAREQWAKYLYKKNQKASLKSRKASGETITRKRAPESVSNDNTESIKKRKTNLAFPQDTSGFLSAQNSDKKRQNLNSQSTRTTNPVRPLKKPKIG